MSESTIEAYNKRAEAYEQRWKAYLEHTHRRFLERIETAEGEMLLDASGGTGLLARELAEAGRSFRHLVVNDPSEAMRSVARRRLGDRPDISFTGYRAGHLAFDASSFDRIFCLNSFHFYPHQQQALAQFHTLLKPGGRLCLLDWDRSGFFRVVNRLIQWGTREHIDTRSLPEMRELLAGAGFIVSGEQRWRWRYWKLFYVEAIRNGGGSEQPAR